MKRKILMRLLRSRIIKELKDLDRRILEMDTEEIISRAGEIETKYELEKAFLDILPCLTEEVTRLLLSMDNVVDYFYLAMISPGIKNYESVYAFLCRNLITGQRSA